MDFWKLGHCLVEFLREVIHSLSFGEDRQCCPLKPIFIVFSLCNLFLDGI